MPDDYRDRHRERTHEDSSANYCPGCGRPLDTADRVDVHHRDGDPTNGSPDNLRVRCLRCHLKGEHDRNVEPGSPSGPRSGPRRPRTAPR